ncbi:MAG: biotin--[acetyl-CoA-carboxylase] ligase [Gammaproteobacteria bacterium]|nr:biotin--[acetyl-CoA-carboxylase] ligase [Gammaproteobacteria bacterium]
MKTVVAETIDLDLDVTVHERIDSTNDWSLQQCKAGRDLPFVCFAEEQISGKGRRGKYWVMTARSNIAMSLAWAFDLSHQSLSLLPLSIALAIVKTLEALNLTGVQIKWPNDVYVHGKKIAGILIETQPIKKKSSSSGSLSAVVIGVGLNYDMSPLSSGVIDGGPESLPDITDIKSEFHLKDVEKIIDRDVVASMLLRDVISICKNFQQDSKQNLEKFRTCYDYCKNRAVDIILDNKEVVSGVVQGVNESAELIVMIDGKTRTFNSAEVSVKADL